MPKPGVDRDRNNGSGRDRAGIALIPAGTGTKYMPAGTGTNVIPAGTGIFPQHSKYLPVERVINVKRLSCFVSFVSFVSWVLLT